MTTDLVSVLDDPTRKMRNPEGLADEDVTALMSAARPLGSRRRDSYFQSLYRTMWVNLLYYTGAQAIETFDVLENVDPGLLLDKGHYVANHILRMVSGNVARLSQARADWSVIPNSPDQKDLDGAKYAQHLLDYAYDHLDLERERVMRSLWLDTVGTVFDYVHWNPRRGARKRVYFDPFREQPLDASQLQPQQQQMLEQIGSYQETNDGDWEHELVSPFQVIFSPKFQRLERWPWVLIRRVMSVDEVWDRWPDKAENITPDEMGHSIDSQFWNRLSTLTHRPGMGITGPADNDDSIVVDELWIPPSTRCPKGLTAYATRRQVLQVGPHEFDAMGIDLRFPLTDSHNIRVPGRFHSMSTVEHLIGPQRDYNRSRQQIIQQRDILATPQWIAPEGAILGRNQRNEYGDWIIYNPSKGRPELQNPPALSQMHIESAGSALNDMQIIASFNDASLGQAPAGARSGNMVMALQERDQLGIGPTVRGLERSSELLGSALLKLAWKNMKLPRAIAIYGESRQADVRYFKGDDLNGNVLVKIRAGSMMPKSKAQTFELITNLLQLGALNTQDLREKRLILEALEVGGHEKLFFELDAARRRARIENRMFAKPDPAMGTAFPDVSVFDDHQAHWEEHLAFTYTDEYELLPPMRKMYFQAHMQKHSMAVGQAIEAQQMVAAAAAGGGGGGSPQARPLGEPSPPAAKNPPPGQSAS